MLNSKTDKQNIQLLNLIAQLRERIDMHRIIGLNIPALWESQVSGALLGYLQRSAHESLAIYTFKFFEALFRNDLNSILEVIESIPVGSVSDWQGRELAAFGKKYGYDAAPADARSYLESTFDRFRFDHSESLDRLKEFRDKVGAHSDYRANITSLPSHGDFERLFGFTKDFYEVVSRAIIGSGPAAIPRTLGQGFVRLIGSLGVQAPKLELEDDK